MNKFWTVSICSTFQIRNHRTISLRLPHNKICFLQVTFMYEIIHLKKLSRVLSMYYRGTHFINKYYRFTAQKAWNSWLGHLGPAFLCRILCVTGSKGLYITDVIFTDNLKQLRCFCFIGFMYHLSFMTQYSPTERAHVIPSPISPQISCEGG